MNNILKLVHTLGKNLHNEISIRQLSKEAEIPYTTTYRMIKKNSFLFIINKKGSTLLCSLDTRDTIVKHYLILAERVRAELWRKKNTPFKVLQQELPAGEYTLILFGSRAEGTQRAKSDFDVCIINKKGKKDINLSKFELLFKIEINPLFLNTKEFAQMLKEKEHNVATEILKKHVILYGEEFFWNLIWKNAI